MQGGRLGPWGLPLCPRILVPGALAAGQAVLVADAGHEVAQAGDPGARLVTAGRDQVQRLALAAVVDAEAAVGVKAAVGVALEDLRLPALAHLLDGVDGDCGVGAAVTALPTAGRGPSHLRLGAVGRGCVKTHLGPREWKCECVGK